MATVAERINKFIVGKRPAAWCDDCIKSRLKLKRRQQSAMITGALATTSEFTREIGQCHDCGEYKLVTSHA